jgi:hypothetical protein
MFPVDFTKRQKLVVTYLSRQAAEPKNNLYSLLATGRAFLKLANVPSLPDTDIPGWPELSSEPVYQQTVVMGAYPDRKYKIMTAVDESNITNGANMYGAFQALVTGHLYAIAGGISSAEDKQEIKKIWVKYKKTEEFDKRAKVIFELAAFRVKQLQLHLEKEAGCKAFYFPSVNYLHLSLPMCDPGQNCANVATAMEAWYGINLSVYDLRVPAVTMSYDMLERYESTQWSAIASEMNSDNLVRSVIFTSTDTDPFLVIHSKHILIDTIHLHPSSSASAWPKKIDVPNDAPVSVLKMNLNTGKPGYNYGVANALDFIGKNLSISVIVYDRFSNESNFIFYMPTRLGDKSKDVQ